MVLLPESLFATAPSAPYGLSHILPSLFSVRIVRTLFSTNYNSVFMEQVVDLALPEYFERISAEATFQGAGRALCAPVHTKNGSRPCACRIQNSRWENRTGGMSYEKV